MRENGGKEVEEKTRLLLGQGKPPAFVIFCGEGGSGPKTQRGLIELERNGKAVNSELAQSVKHAFAD